MQKFLKKNLVVGQIISKHYLQEMEKFAIKTNITNNIVKYIIFTYNIHYYGKCKEKMSMIDKPVNLIILTVNLDNQMIIGIDHYNNCCPISDN